MLLTKYVVILFFAISLLLVTHSALALSIYPAEVNINSSNTSFAIFATHNVELQSDCDWFSHVNGTIYVEIENTTTDQKNCTLLFSRTDAPESVKIFANVTIPQDVPRVRAEESNIGEIPLNAPNISLPIVSQKQEELSFSIDSQMILIVVAIILLVLGIVKK